MPDLTLVCPDCGGTITLCLVTQPGAFADATVAHSLTQPLTQADANGEIAHVSEFLDLNPATKRARAYNQGYDQDFLRFWEAYPLHRDKRKAQIAWRKAVRRLDATGGANLHAAMAQILDGAIRYRDDPNRVDQFTRYAEGWLNGDCWEDDPLPERLAPGTLPAIGLPESQEDIDAKIATYLGGDQ